MSAVVAALFVGVGMSLLVVGFLARVRQRDVELAALLDLPYGEHDVPVATATEHGLLEGTIGVAGRVIEQLDAKGALLVRLEKARVPMRPAEFVLVCAAAGIMAAVLIGVVTAQPVLGALALVLSPVAAVAYLNTRIARRRKRFEEQLPEALSVIASSLSAGHTFLRSIQLMQEESEPPMSEEFARVVQETRLGDPLVDALERMAHRVELPDLVWVVQAIRIQQQVGGKLADLLHTLTEFMRARQEIRREVDVLTAEGRISAWVLGGLPIFLMIAIQVMSPGYMAPLFRGAGLVVLGLTGLAIIAGVAIIRRMSNIEV